MIALNLAKDRLGALNGHLSVIGRNMSSTAIITSITQRRQPGERFAHRCVPTAVTHEVAMDSRFNRSMFCKLLVFFAEMRRDRMKRRVVSPGRASVRVLDHQKTSSFQRTLGSNPVFLGLQFHSQIPSEAAFLKKDEFPASKSSSATGTA